MNVRFDHIEDAEILSEQATSLNDGDNAFISWIARQIDSLAGKERGGLITEALVLAELTNNPKALRQAYKDGKPQIDRYFNQVDIQQIVKQAGPGVQTQIQTALADRAKNNIPGFIAGGLLTAGIIFVLKQRNKQ